MSGRKGCLPPKPDAASGSVLNTSLTDKDLSDPSFDACKSASSVESSSTGIEKKHHRNTILNDYSSVDDNDLERKETFVTADGVLEDRDKDLDPVLMVKQNNDHSETEYSNKEQLGHERRSSTQDIVMSDNEIYE